MMSWKERPPRCRLLGATSLLVAKSIGQCRTQALSYRRLWRAVSILRGSTADSAAFFMPRGGPKHFIDLTQSTANRTVIVKPYRVGLCGEIGMSRSTGLCGIRHGAIKGVEICRR